MSYRSQTFKHMALYAGRCKNVFYLPTVGGGRRVRRKPVIKNTRTHTKKQNKARDCSTALDVGIVQAGPGWFAGRGAQSGRGYATQRQHLICKKNNKQTNIEQLGYLVFPRFTEHLNVDTRLAFTLFPLKVPTSQYVIAVTPCRTKYRTGLKRKRF